MREKRLCSWWCLSSSSLKLFGLIVPVILVSGFVGLVGPKNSNWVFDSNKLYPWAWSSVIPSSSSSSSAMFVGLKSNSTRDSVSAKEEHLDAVSSSDESILYRSSPPPLPINPTHKTQPTQKMAGWIEVGTLYSNGCGVTTHDRPPCRALNGTVLEFFSFPFNFVLLIMFCGAGAI